METSTIDRQRLARWLGVLFVGLLVFGMLTALVLGSVLVPGDAAATTANVLGSRTLVGVSLVGWVVLAGLDIAVAVGFHALLKTAGPVLSPITAGFRLVYAAVLVALVPQLFTAFRLVTGDATDQARALAEMESFSLGFQVALTVFGIHMTLLGILLYRSAYVPRILAGLVVAAGAGYVADNLAGLFTDLAPALSAVLVAPSLLGELGLLCWLLVKGVRVPGRAIPAQPAPL